MRHLDKYFYPCEHDACLYENEGEQLEIGDVRAFVELQSAAQVRELGFRALELAQHHLNIAYECRDALVEWGEIEKSRKKPVNVRAALPELSAGTEG